MYPIFCLLEGGLYVFFSSIVCDIKHVILLRSATQKALLTRFGQGHCRKVPVIAVDQVEGAVVSGFRV